MALVSLVSVSARNWYYSCGKVERVETGETLEIASIQAVLMHVAENMVGCGKRLGEYPTTLTKVDALSKIILRHPESCGFVN